jgi:hypothetical protein
MNDHFPTGNGTMCDGDISGQVPSELEDQNAEPRRNFIFPVLVTLCPLSDYLFCTSTAS